MTEHRNFPSEAPGHAPVRNDVNAKQGDRNPVTLWILIAAVLLAGIAGWVLLSGTESFTADREAPLENVTEAPAQPEPGSTAPN